MRCKWGKEEKSIWKRTYHRRNLIDGTFLKARQSERPMTVQHRRKLRKKIKHITILLCSPELPFLPLFHSLRQGAAAPAAAHGTKAATAYPATIQCHKDGEEGVCPRWVLATG